MRSLSLHARSYFAGSAVALALAAPALAQQASQTPAGIEEIIVTAERRSQRLQDVPVAMSAFDERALQKRGAARLEDISSIVPSLEIHSTSRPGGGGSSIAAYIRGVGTGDYNIPTDPAIGVYVDGVYLARSVGGLLSLTDIEQIQVLNGPQGTLYGRNTLGGAILVTTRQPLLNGEPDARLGVRVGSNDRADIWMSVNAPLVADKLGAKFSISTLNSDGWARQSLTGRRLSNEHRFILKGALTWAATEELSLTLNADYTRQRQNPPIVPSVLLTAPPARLAQYNTLVAPRVNSVLGLPAGSILDSRWIASDLRTSASTAPVRDDSDNGGASLKITYDRSPALQVNAVTAYRSLDARISVSSDSTPYNVFYSSGHFRDNQFSQEVTVGGTLMDGRLTYLVGAYYFEEQGKNLDEAQIFHGLYEVNRAVADALDTNTFQDLRAKSYALFTQETFALLPNLNITAGARINKDKKDYFGFVLRPQANLVGVPPQTNQGEWTSFTPKVSIDWKPMQDVMLYGSYAEGFKSGGVTTPILGFAPSTYEPETLKTYEAGFKSSWLDRRLTLNAAAYTSRYEDVQLTSIVALPGGGSGRPTQNAGDAKIRGAEFELVAIPVRGLTLNAAGGLTHARFKTLIPGAVSALGSRVGDRLPQIPDYNFSGGAEYRFDAAGGELSLRADIRVTGKTHLTAGDVDSFRDAYTLVNLGATYAPAWAPNLELALRGTNVTDRDYIVFSSRSPSTGIRGVIPGAPREWFLTASYRF